MYDRNVLQRHVVTVTLVPLLAVSRARVTFFERKAIDSGVFPSARSNFTTQFLVVSAGF